MNEIDNTGLLKTIILNDRLSLNDKRKSWLILYVCLFILMGLILIKILYLL